MKVLASQTIDQFSRTPTAYILDSLSCRSFIIHEQFMVVRILHDLF